MEVGATRTKRCASNLYNLAQWFCQTKIMTAIFLPEHMERAGIIAGLNSMSLNVLEEKEKC